MNLKDSERFYFKIPFQYIMNHFHLTNDSLEPHEIASKKEQDTLAGIN